MNKISNKCSAIQIKQVEVKGVLMVDPNLENNTIIFRANMNMANNQQYNHLEILDYGKYRPGYLNR